MDASKRTEEAFRESIPSFHSPLLAAGRDCSGIIDTDQTTPSSSAQPGGLRTAELTASCNQCRHGLHWVPGWDVLKLEIPVIETYGRWRELRPWVIFWMLTSIASGSLAIYTGWVILINGILNFCGVFGLIGGILAFIAGGIYLCRLCDNTSMNAKAITTLARVAFGFDLFGLVMPLLELAFWIVGANPDAVACEGVDTDSCLEARLPVALSMLTIVVLIGHGWLGLRIGGVMKALTVPVT